jgi:hypothetical protein
MHTTSQQKRHEKLIDFLSQFEHYQYGDGAPKINGVSEPRGAEQASRIPVQDINVATFALVDLLNLEGGAVADIDLFELLQVYLRVPNARVKINRIVKADFPKVYAASE